ncbi:MAG: DUF1826 domain-containing protein [Oligoflexales bacterium]
MRLIVLTYPQSIVKTSPRFMTKIFLCLWSQADCEERNQYARKLAFSGFQFAKIVSLESLSDHLEFLPSLPGATSMKSWINELVEMFSILFDQKNLGLRISSMEKPMCPKFHVDHVPARLIHCLYGESCQWVNDMKYFNSNANVDIKTWTQKAENPNSKVSIAQAPNRSVVIMKGTAWRDGTIPIIHRSPQHIEARCVLTLDIAERANTFAFSN